MKKAWVVVVILSLLVVLAMPALAAEKKPLATSAGVTMKDTGSITATVEKIDYQTRTVVLKGTKGNLVDLQVGEEARNFNQLKKGDLVTFAFSGSVAIELQKAKGEATATETTSVTRAKPGQKPGGTMETTGTMIVKVEKINYKTREVTLKMDDGSMVDITAGPQVKRLDEVHKGDEVVVRYTSTVSISVKTP